LSGCLSLSLGAWNVKGAAAAESFSAADVRLTYGGRYVLGARCAGGAQLLTAPKARRERFIQSPRTA